MAAIWTAPRTATTGELETAAFWNTYVRDNEEYLKATLDSHAAATSPHSATNAATANRLMLRDASGRAQVAMPSAAADIARKDTVDAVQSSLDSHAGLTNPHSATNAATANRLMLRDASGRAKVAAPSASDDIAQKAQADAVQSNLNSHTSATTSVHGLGASVALVGCKQGTRRIEAKQSSEYQWPGDGSAPHVFTITWDNAFSSSVAVMAQYLKTDSLSPYGVWWTVYGVSSTGATSCCGGANGAKGRMYFLGVGT